MERLGAVRALGWSAPANLTNDPDFAALHDNPRWREAVPNRSADRDRTLISALPSGAHAATVRTLARSARSSLGDDGWDPMKLLALLLIVTPALAEDLFTITARAEERDGAWTFVVEGKTLLADGARLELEVAIPRVETYRDGEVWKYDDTVEDGKATAIGGAFSAALGRMARKPYSMTYLARVTFDPTVQPKDVLMDLETRGLTVSEPVSKDVEFAVGSPADLDRERLEADKRVIEDFTATRTLFEELEARFKGLYTSDAPPDLEAWDAWRKEWDARIAPIVESNERRIGQDIYWRESYGKRYLEAMLDGLSELADFYREVLAAPKAKRPPEDHVARAGKMFEAKYWERLDFLQISLIAHPGTVLQILDETEERVKRLLEMRALAAKKDAAFSPEAWEKEAADARMAFVQLPARLSAELPETYFGLVTKLCRDLVALLGPPEAAVDAAPVMEAIARLRNDAESQRK